MNFELTLSLKSLGEKVPEYLVQEALQGAQHCPVTEQAVEALRDLEDRGTSRILVELLKIT